MRHTLQFPNPQGEKLSALLETPDTGDTKAYALFAHCFTCSKDVAAASRISRALAGKGIAVLRFDFTGLGNSDGDFANTNFSSNLQDLQAAAACLAEHYQPPLLLIGHSLGGAAVLAAAQHLPYVKAVATIGAPATADHVAHLFEKSKDTILRDNQARVNLGGRHFTIKRQFVEDIARHNTTEHIGAIKKALLVLHSPVDTIVPIDEAAKIFRSAKHPKSFISLDKADHLLSRREDSQYAAEVIAGWAGRYLGFSQAQEEHSSGTAPSIPSGEVRVTELDHQFGRRLFTHKHQLFADEPIEIGGKEAGPTPYDLLLAALGACTSMTIRVVARHKKIPLDDVQVSLRHQRNYQQDCQASDAGGQQGMEAIEREIYLAGNLSDDDRARLMAIADKCPVHKTITGKLVIPTKALDKPV